MKSYFSRSSHIEKDDNSILTDIAKTRCALETAYAGFDNATDPDLIDCYIYEVNAVHKRYKYLLHEAAKMNLQPQHPMVYHLARDGRPRRQGQFVDGVCITSW